MYGAETDFPRTMTEVSSGSTRPQERTAEQIQAVTDTVRRHFQVSQEYIVAGSDILQFFLESGQPEIKQNFLLLTEDLKKYGEMAILRNSDHGPMLSVVRKAAKGKQRIKLHLALFIATICTVFVYGFLSSYNYSFQKVPSFSQDLYVAAIFTVCLMAIIGIHELGHKIASWHHKMDSSWPYFIPFPGIAIASSFGIALPETFPTLGAVISARDPPPNRDALFDLGISGPIAGLITTIGVAIYAATTAQVASTNISGSSGDLFTNWITGIMHPASQQGVLVGPLFYTLYFAYFLGFLLTFLNLLPAWQLDGGHVANAALNPRIHKYLTWASAAIMLLTGFLFLAILVILFASRVPSLRPLDDVSPLSGKRKMMFWATWIIAGAIFFLTIYGNLYYSLFNIF
jgi:Zn-dependent protease